MAASAERELWLDANEMTYQKYWDTVCFLPFFRLGVVWELTIVVV